ncbi:hypothetical protein M0802_004406 [Mischocyttarus mexicanus]|nr:hypothetical protein M0802_004406 [Mischocyttarus mexicanus]
MLKSIGEEEEEEEEEKEEEEEEEEGYGPNVAGERIRNTSLWKLGPSRSLEGIEEDTEKYFTKIKERERKRETRLGPGCGRKKRWKEVFRGIGYIKHVGFSLGSPWNVVAAGLMAYAMRHQCT